MRIPYKLEHLKRIVEGANSLGVADDAFIYLEIDDHFIPVLRQEMRELDNDNGKEAQNGTVDV
jgi:hypothetical protein